MVMQLTVEICTGLKSNMNTEKMTRCKQVHEHIEYMEFLKVRTFQSFFFLNDTVNKFSISKIS